MVKLNTDPATPPRKGLLQVSITVPTRPASVGLEKKGRSFATDLSCDTLFRRDLSSCIGSSLGCLCGAVPSTANTSRAGAAACRAPSVSHLRSQPVAKPVGFTSFLLQRTVSIPPAGTMLGGSLAKYRLSMILQGQSENHIPQMTAPLFPSKQIINRKSQL